MTVPGALGGTSPFSISSETVPVTITPTNNAPTLKTTGFPVLPSTTGTTTGVQIPVLPARLISDPDAETLKGIAVTKSPADFGTWEYSPNGTLWSSSTIFPTFPTLSDTNAFLFPASYSIRVDPYNVSASGLAAFNFRAWDRSVGTLATVNTTKGLVASAFSKTFETVTMAYNNGNDKPLLDTSF